MDELWISMSEMEELTGSWWRTNVDSTTTTVTLEMFNKGMRMMDEGPLFHQLEFFREQLKFL